MTEEGFPTPLGLGIGKMEEHMGQDAYQAQVANSKAVTELNEALAAKTNAKAEYWRTKAVARSAYGFLGLIIVSLVAMPVIVWLWRWAVS